MPEPVRILIVEDLAEDADLAQHEIRKTIQDCEFQLVATRRDFLDALNAFQPDLILADYILPRFDGLEALKLTFQQAPLTAFIIWSGSIREDLAVECMKAGASDYVFKENLKRLGPAVLRALEEKELLVARKQAEEALENSERRFRALVQNGLASIALLAEDGMLLWESPAVTGTLHYAPNEHLGRNIFKELMHPDDLPWTQELFAKVVREPGSNHHGTFRLRHADGTWHWVEAIVTNMLHEPTVNAIVANYRDVHEQKVSEIALQHSEKRFRALIENGLDDISLLAADGTLLWESPSTVRNLGYAPDEFVGRNIFELMHPQDLEWTSKAFAELLQKPGDRQSGLFRLCRADGTWRWVEAIATNLLNEPSVNAIVVNYRDITEHRQAEEAFRESQAKYQHLVETSHDLIWSVDAEGKITFLNRAAKGIYGYEPEELIGRSFLELMDPGNDHPREFEKIRGLMGGTDEFQELESHVHHRDGRQIVLSANSVALRDEQGYVTGVTGTSRDITARKQMEEALKEERNLLRTLIDNIPDRIYAMDLQGRKTLSNTADWKASGGKTMEDVIGKTDFDTYPPELAEQFWQLDRAVLDSGQVIVNFEEPGLDAEGNQVSILTTKIPLQNEEGKVIGLVGIGRDITERKQVEVERQALLEIMQGLASTKDLQEFLKLVHHSIEKVICAKNFFVMLYQENSGLYEEIYSVDQYDPPMRPSKLENSITAYVFRSGQPLLLTQAAFDELAAQGEVELIGTDSASWLGVPLKTSNRTIGVIAVQDYDNPNRYTERDKEFLASIASQVALAIERKQADLELQQKNDDLGLLNGINEAVVQGQDLDSIVERLAKELSRIFSTQGNTIYSTLYLLNPDRQSIRIQKYFFSSEMVLRIERLLGFRIPTVEIPIKEGGHFHTGLKSKRSTLTTDPKAIQDWIAEFANTRFLHPVARATVRKFIPQIHKLLNINSVILVPLVSGEEMVGFWDVSNTGLFTHHDLERIENIGGQLTAVLQRQRADEKTRRSEEFLQSVQNALSASVAILDESGTIVRVNAAWREFGKQNGLAHADACVGLNYLDICDGATGPHAEEASLVAQAIRAVIGGHRSEARIEYPCHSPKEQRWFTLHITKFEDGDHVWVVLAHENITERKEAEESLRAERRKAEKYLEIAGVMMLALDREGTVSLINQKGCEILGYPADEIVGKNWIQTFLPEAVREELQDFFRKLISDDIQGPAYYENAILTKSGEKRLIAWHNTMLRDEQGRIIGTLSSGEDITERKQAEEALRHSESKARALLNALPDLMFRLDREATILDYKADPSELYVQSESELIGYRLRDISPPEFAALIDLYIQKTVESGVMQVFEYQLPIQNGDLHDFEARMITSGPDEVTAIVRNITERKRAEEEIRRRAEETAALLKASLALTNLDLQATLQTTGNSAKNLFAADGCRIFLMEPDGETLHCALALQENFAAFSDLRIPIGAGVTGAVAASGQAEIVNQMHKDPRSMQVPDTPEEEPEAIMFAPLKERERTIGVISIRRAGTERPFQPADLELLKAFASIAASAVSNARLFEETQRRLADLHASEERFRQLADNIQEVFWMTDAENDKELYMSPAAETIWGRPLQSLMYEPDAYMNSVYSEDRAAVREAIAREKKGERAQLEYRIVRPDGSLRWIWDRAFPICDEIGKVKRIAGISADITDRREAELALLKSQSRYRELFDSSPISIWEEDYSLVKKRIDALLQNGIQDLSEYLSSHPEVIHELASLVKVTDVNKASLELYHLEQKESLLKGLIEAVGGESISHFEQELLGLLSPQKRFIWEGTDRTSDGRTMQVSVIGSIPQGYEEDWSKVIVTISDITERKLAEQQLRKLSRAVEQTGSTIVITDPSGKIEYVNPKFTEITGYSFEEVVGQNPRILKSGLTQDEEYQHLWQTITSGREWHGEFLNKKKDGTLYWESVTISPILNDRREITHYVGVKEDITKRKQSEIETHRHIAELEAVYANGLSVGRLLEPAEIGNRFIETVARYLPWHHVTIRLRQEDSDTLELVAFNLPNLKEEDREDAEQHFVARINKVGQGLSGWVIQTGEPFRTGSVHTHPQYLDTHAGIQSGLYMPLKIGERVIGVISVESEVPDAFTEQDERLLATLANQTAIAFENARLYEAMQRELSERKRVENALRISETHYRALADSITDILFEMDQDLRYTHWNKASEALIGISASDAIGKSMEAVLGKTEEQARIRAIYQEILRTHQPRTFETILVFNGENRSFEVNAYPSMRGVSVVAKDVTDRKRTETIMQKRFELMEYSGKHSLQELMQRTVDEVSQLTRSMIGFFHFMNEDQNSLGLQIWSTNALQVFQVPLEEGCHLPLDRAGLWAEALRRRRPLIQNDVEGLVAKKDLPRGHVPILREIVIPIIRNERIMAVMGIGNKPEDYTPHDLEVAARLADYAWDVIERKQMEIALETERNQLVQRVEERTADLSRANSNLARALRVKDEFLANMSHELRTPLNAILGLSESLAEQIAGPLNEKQQKYISTISESGHHLLSLINDILDLAKIDAGQITLDINKVDIHSVCQASLRMVKQLAQKKNQEVLLDIDRGLGLMWADERRLKQMIVNLLGNAVKFTPENGKLGLEVRGDQEANQISITVWDNGIGIKEDDLARLFQPFVQLDSGLAREATGTGLGLALVSQMARLHGGSVRAMSEPGKGSRFTITLPWEPALALDTASRMKITGKFRSIQFDETNKPTILLVEDTKEVVMMLRDYLELAGYRVYTAQDGIDGIAQAKLVKPDLILMDVQMPRMDGFETTRKLRGDPNFRYTPIIALTALAMPHDRERCLEAGMDEYISKPVNLKALIKTIQSCLFEQSSRA